LVVRVFKAKYFPNCSFLQAKVRPRCSYVWQSIAAARTVLDHGSKWRVGNGANISICKDRWLPDQGNYKIPYPIEALPEEAVVADLIDVDRGMWKVELIQRCFSPGDGFHILKYPLIPSLPTDTLIWWGTPNGKFSVKSAYHTAFSRLQRCLGARSFDVVHMNQFWKSIWALNLPRKIINFVWRLCSNILPT
jgi:hypothetical protein